MAYTGLATKVYKDPITTIWANSIKDNFDQHQANQVIKGWAMFDGSGVTILKSYNVNTITRLATGAYTVVWDTDMSSTNYAFTFNAGTRNNWSGALCTLLRATSASCDIVITNGFAGTDQQDRDMVTIMAVGT